MTLYGIGKTLFWGWVGWIIGHTSLVLFGLTTWRDAVSAVVCSGMALGAGYICLFINWKHET